MFTEAPVISNSLAKRCSFRESPFVLPEWTIGNFREQLNRNETKGCF